MTTPSSPSRESSRSTVRDCHLTTTSLLSHDYQINVSCLSRDCPAQQLNCTRALQLVADALEKLLASKEQCTLTSLLFFQHIVRRLCLSSLGFFIYIYFCVSIHLFICIFVFVYCCHIISSSPFRPFQVLYLTGHTHSHALTYSHVDTHSRTVARRHTETSHIRPPWLQLSSNTSLAHDLQNIPS